MPDDKIFGMARLALVDEALGIENVRRDLKLREARFTAALKRLREACAHPDVVEIRYEWNDVIGDCAKRRASGRRYCLACGTDESASTYDLGDGRRSYRYDRLGASEVVRRDVCHASDAYTGMLEPFIERLHALARFDEFDGKGVWIGAKKPDDHVRKGEG